MRRRSALGRRAVAAGAGLSARAPGRGRCPALRRAAAARARQRGGGDRRDRGAPRAVVVRPAPLDREAATALVRARLDPEADPEFCAACQATTQGNPLLLCELSRELADRGVQPTAAAAATVDEVIPRGIAPSVLRRVRGVHPQASAVAGAVAILGDGAEPGHVAALSGLDPGAANAVLEALARVEVLARADLPTFAHPMVRAAIAAEVEARPTAAACTSRRPGCWPVTAPRPSAWRSTSPRRRPPATLGGRHASGGGRGGDLARRPGSGGALPAPGPRRAAGGGTRPPRSCSPPAGPRRAPATPRAIAHLQRAIESAPDVTDARPRGADARPAPGAGGPAQGRHRPRPGGARAPGHRQRAVAPAGGRDAEPAVMDSSQRAFAVERLARLDPAMPADGQGACMLLAILSNEALAKVQPARGGHRPRRACAGRRLAHGVGPHVRPRHQRADAQRALRAGRRRSGATSSPTPGRGATSSGWRSAPPSGPPRTGAPGRWMRRSPTSTCPCMSGPHGCRR